MHCQKVFLVKIKTSESITKYIFIIEKGIYIRTNQMESSVLCYCCLYVKTSAKLLNLLTFLVR